MTSTEGAGCPGAPAIDSRVVTRYADGETCASSRVGELAVHANLSFRGPQALWVRVGEP